MKMLARAALALPALLACAPAAAQSLAGKAITAPAGYLPGVAAYCDDGTGHAAICSGGGGGGGGGDASAANQIAVQAAPGADAAKAVAVQGVTGGKAVAVTVSGGATAARQDTGNAALATIAANTTGAATAARQPAPGTAGAPSADVLTVQGASAGTPLYTMPLLPQLATTAHGGAYGTAAATLMAANGARHFIVVQNQSATASCYVRGGGAAATTDYNSLLIAPGAYFESSTHVGTGAISIVCTAASTPVYAVEG